MNERKFLSFAFINHSMKIDRSLDSDLLQVKIVVASNIARRVESHYSRATNKQMNDRGNNSTIQCCCDRDVLSLSVSPQRLSRTTIDILRV